MSFIFQLFKMVFSATLVFFTNPRFYISYFYPTTSFQLRLFSLQMLPVEETVGRSPDMHNGSWLLGRKRNLLLASQVARLSVYQSVLYHKSIYLCLYLYFCPSVPLSLFLSFSLSLFLSTSLHSLKISCFLSLDLSVTATLCRFLCMSRY